MRQWEPDQPHKQLSYKPLWLFRAEVKRVERTAKIGNGAATVIFTCQGSSRQYYPFLQCVRHNLYIILV